MTTWIEEQQALLPKTPYLDKISNLAAEMRRIDAEEAEHERLMQERQDAVWAARAQARIELDGDE